MSDTSQGPGWWLASDGRWYPPETWTGPPQVATPPSYPSYPTNPSYPAYGTVGSAALPYQQAPVRHGNGMAVASLVCSLCGVVPFFFGVSCILGIIFGFVARSQIRRSNGQQSGDGMALAGIIIGFSLILVFLVVVILIAVLAKNTTCGGNLGSCAVN
jgi:uncharacterized protein DUF4190